MEVIHLFYLLTIFVGWFDRTFFQSRLDRLPGIADYLSQPYPIPPEGSLSIPAPRRPLAALGMIALALVFSSFLSTGLVIGPGEFLLMGLGFPKAARAGIQLPIMVFLTSSFTILFAWMWIRSLWFPDLELTSDQLICRMGAKTMRIPWIALDCLPSEPFLIPKNDPPLATLRPPARVILGGLIVWEENGVPRKPWAPESFPIQISEPNALGLQNRFRVNHLALLRFLAGVAAMQVSAGRGLTTPVSASPGFPDQGFSSGS